MEPISKHTGLVMPLDRVDVDTDQVIPKQFLKMLTRQGYGKFLFYDWRYGAGDVPNPDFVMNSPLYQGASVLLARANFGCGSSREHAPWALLDYGFRVIIAPSFADIFCNNCFKNGLLPVALSETQVDELFRRSQAQAGYRLTIDLPSQTVRDEQGLEYRFAISAFLKQVLIEGLDDIGLTLTHAKDIDAYEKSHHPSAIIYESVDFTPSAPNR